VRALILLSVGLCGCGFDTSGLMPAPGRELDAPADVGSVDARTERRPAKDTRPGDAPLLPVDLRRDGKPTLDTKLTPDTKPAPDTKPTPDVSPPLKSCDQLYATVPRYELCSQAATECVFYTNSHKLNPSTLSCAAACGPGRCISAAQPVGFTDHAVRCAAFFLSPCGTAATLRLCTCKRVP
jgi:hypothetical protein